MAKLKQASVPRIFIERASNRVRVKIYTARPGIVIGRKGSSTLARRIIGGIERGELLSGAGDVTGALAAEAPAYRMHPVLLDGALALAPGLADSDRHGRRPAGRLQHGDVGAGGEADVGGDGATSGEK